MSPKKMALIASCSWRYPASGDPLPPEGEEVMLIRRNGEHTVGTWSPSCKAWAFKAPLKNPTRPKT